MFVCTLLLKGGLYQIMYIVQNYTYIYIYTYIHIHTYFVLFFFQANMPTEVGHSSEISECTANSFPADEDTPLVPEANSESRQHRLCEQFNCRHFFLCLFLLFLLAEAVLLIIIVKFALVEYFGRNSTNAHPDVLEEQNMKVIISLNVAEIGNCFFFLGIIVKSPSFVGFSSLLKDLCRLPNFWTLLLSFLLYFLIAVSAIIQIVHHGLIPFYRLIIVQMTLEILDFFSLVILVVFLNHTKLRHTISGRAYILLKGPLILFCFRFFLMVVGNTITLIYARDTNDKVTQAKKITELLLLPFVKKITELLWEKIFFDEKRIIGKMRRNRNIHQITFVI